MKISIHKFEENYKDCISVQVNIDGKMSKVKKYPIAKFSESDAMYSHILAYILSKIDKKWTYKLESEYVGDYDMIYQCKVYYDSQLVIDSYFSEYNCCGAGVGIIQTIESFKNFGIDVSIQQDLECGGWCYDEC